jgi:hypothetical protein
MPGGAEVAKSVVIAILADTKKFVSDVDGAGKKASGFAGVLAGVGKAAAIGLAAAGTAAVGFVAMSIRAAAAAQKVAAQTEAVLESTGGAAGRTLTQIGKLAGQLSALSGVDDEVVQAGQNVLLTFTRIRGANFDRATRSALNLSVALGTDMNAAAMLVGKALNDPLKGMSALSRAGVQLTDEQRSLVQQMVAVGDVAGAQAILLAELETQFGGSAEAFGRTFSGALGRVQTIFGNLQESIGGALLPALTIVLNRIADFLGMLQESTAFTTFVTNLTNFTSGILDGTIGLADIGSIITGGITRAADWLAGGGIETIATAFLNGRAALFDAGLRVFPAIVEALLRIVPKVLQQLAAMVPKLLRGAVEMFRSLVDAVLLVLPSLITTIVGLVPVLLTTLIGLIPDLIAGAIALFMALVQAIPVVVPLLVQAIVDLIPVLITTLIDLIPVLLEAAVQLLLAIVDAIPIIIPTLIDAVFTLIPAIVGALVGAIPEILAAGVDLIGGVISAVGEILPKLLDAGGEIVQGLWDGISAGWRDFMRWWDSTVGAVVDTVKAVFGIRSPSRVFRGIGVNVVRGLEHGLAAPNRIGAIMGSLTDAVSGGFSASIEAPDGYRSGGRGNRYDIHLPIGMPSADAGREIVRAIEEYERLGGVA